MDFVVGLPWTQNQYDSILVVVDRITKSAYFIQVKSTNLAQDYAIILIEKIVCFNGILLSIISDQVEQFASRSGGHYKKGYVPRLKFRHHFSSPDICSSGAYCENP